MPYTLLQLVNQVEDEIGLTRSNSVIGNTAMQVRQMLALANKVGRDLVRDFEWRRIVKERIFQTSASRSATALVSSANTLTGLTSASSLIATGDLVSGTGVPQWAEAVTITETQITLNVNCEGTATATVSCTFAKQYYDLPSDFDRQVSRTQWDRSDHWGMAGPKSSQEWQWLKGGMVATGPVYRWRLYGNRMKLTPAPATRLRLANEYVANTWISTTTAAEPTLTTFAADTEMAIFPDDVMVNGLKFHWYKTKGLDFAVPLAEFSRSLSYAKAQDQPAPILSLSPEPRSLLISADNIPDGNWPS